MLHWVGDLSLPSFHPIFPLLFVTIEPLIIVFYYYDEGYNVFLTIEFFLHIDVMMVESTIIFLEQDTQGSLGVNTFLNSFDHWLLDSKYNFTHITGDNTVPLKDWFELWHRKKTNNITN